MLLEKLRSALDDGHLGSFNVHLDVRRAGAELRARILNRNPFDNPGITCLSIRQEVPNTRVHRPIHLKNNLAGLPAQRLLHGLHIRELM